MTPSSYSSIHTSTGAYSYASPVSDFSQTISYLDHTSGFYEDPSSSAEGWSGDYAGPAEWSDADRALFEALVTVEVTNTSPSSGSRTLIPMPSSPSYSPEPSFLYDQTETPSPHVQSLDGSRLCLSVAVMSTVSPASGQVSRETMVSDTSLDLMYPSHQDAFSPHICRSAGEMSRSFYTLSFSHPSLSPEPSPQASSIDIAPQRRNGTAAPTSHLPIPLAFKQSRSELAMPSISPDLIYPSSVHCRYDLEDDRSISVSPQSSRASHRASPHSSSFLPHPSPSPSPSPCPSSVIRASQRRNAPASTTVPVGFNTWRCPYCPHVQHNRRSPDLKRHIKTHMRGAADVADWVCCGVPVLDAIELGMPVTTVQEAQVFDFDGTLMLGGCRKAFSRHDALIRYLQREKGRCFGDVQSLYQWRNRESMSCGGLW